MVVTLSIAGTIAGAGYVMKGLKTMKMVTTNITGRDQEQVPIQTGAGSRLIPIKTNTL